MTEQSSLHRKIAEIQGELRAVPKSGLNTFHKYRYSTEQDVLDTVRPLCSKNNLSLVTTCVNYQVTKGVATVEVETRLTDSESGEFVTVRMPGYAEDAKGDKAIYKAITGATKYAIWKMFNLSTDEDPERDSGEKPRVKPRGNDYGSKEKIGAIAKLLGYEAPEIRRVLQAEFPGGTAAQLNEDECATVIDALLIDWGMQQGVFDHHKHALNSFGNLTASLDENVSSEQLVIAWMEKVSLKKRELVKTAGQTETQPAQPT